MIVFSKVYKIEYFVSKDIWLTDMNVGSSYLDFIKNITLQAYQWDINVELECIS